VGVQDQPENSTAMAVQNPLTFFHAFALGIQENFEYFNLM